MRKVDDAWVESTFAQAGEIVTEIGLGLIDLGLGPGERIGILSRTRPEWTYCDMAATSAGLAVVPIYPTNAPQECAWVLGELRGRRRHLRERGAGSQDRRARATRFRACVTSS